MVIRGDPSLTRDHYGVIYTNWQIDTIKRRGLIGSIIVSSLGQKFPGSVSGVEITPVVWGRTVYVSARQWIVNCFTPISNPWFFRPSHSFMHIKTDQGIVPCGHIFLPIREEILEIEAYFSPHFFRRCRLLRLAEQSPASRSGPEPLPRSKPLRHGISACSVFSPSVTGSSGSLVVSKWVRKM